MRKKKTYLFGIPVEKKVKTRIVLCSIFAALFFLIYIILSFFYEPKVENVSVLIPNSGLSQSVFDTQNMTYSTVADYTAKHTFKNVPFTIDTVLSQSAKLGNGEVYNSGEYYFYYSDMDKNEDIGSVLVNELTDVLLLGGDKESTTISTVFTDNGYINGCEGVFYILNMTACRDSSVVNGSLCIYELNVHDAIYDGDRKLLVGCLTIGDVAVNTYENLCTLAYANVATLQYSEAIEKSLKNEANKENATNEENVADGENSTDGEESVDEPELTEPAEGQPQDNGDREEQVVEDE